MDFDFFRMKYLERILQGDRIGCRKVLSEALQTGTPINVIYTDLFWPIMAELETLYRNHRIDRITEHMATRINRSLVNQLQGKLRRGTGSTTGHQVAVDDNPIAAQNVGVELCAELGVASGAPAGEQSVML